LTQCHPFNGLKWRCFPFVASQFSVFHSLVISRRNPS